jgi:predicted dienelactone hydrolase
MRLLIALSTLLVSACCTSLPRLPAKKLPFPSPAALGDPAVVEHSEVWRDEKRNRDVPVKIYGQRGPVVVVSHGIGENRDSYAYLGRALAAHGYRAVHITHAGTDRAVLERGYRHLYRAVKQKENWVNRPLDVSFVLDRLAVSEAAIVGHSAGAFTAFALAGMRMNDGTLRDPRVNVAVAMSMPRMEGVIPPGGYDSIAIPVLNVTGTCDTSIIYRTFPKHRRIPFDATHAANQYLLTFEGVNHDTFVVEDRRNAEIAAATIAFLDAWTRGDDAAAAWFDDPGLGAIGAVGASVERKKEGAR